MYYKHSIFCLVLISFFSFIHSQKMIVNSCLANLYSNPSPIPEVSKGPILLSEAWSQVSQCLFGECILGEPLADKPEWVKVSALGQKTLLNSEWIPYPGFIQASHLSRISEFPRYNIVLQNPWTILFTKPDTYNPMFENITFKFLPMGTRLQAIKINNQKWNVTFDNQSVGYLKCEEGDGIYEILANIHSSQTEYFRTKIVEISQLFLNQHTPYVWGGVSPFHILLNQITGVDCSGLVRLCYLACGLEIPRNAQPQYQAANKLPNGRNLHEADLIFFSKNIEGTQINHVMIYIGNGMVIESTGLGLSSKKEAQAMGINLKELGVREISIKELIGADISDIESGKTVSKNRMYVLLGSYFAPENKIQKMRNIALGLNDVW